MPGDMNCIFTKVLIPFVEAEVGDTGVATILREAGHTRDYLIADHNWLPLALADRDVYVRTQAATSLGKFGPDSKAAVSALISALRDPTKEVRVAAAYALAEIGPAAREAAKALKQMTKEKEGDVRTAATIALRAVEAGP